LRKDFSDLLQPSLQCMPAPRQAPINMENCRCSAKTSWRDSINNSHDQS
jgi:hypothetical protein